MTWTAHLAETLTGQVGPALELLGGTWTDGPLNGPTSGQVTVPVKHLRGYAPHWWSPWSGSVLVCHDSEPIVWGPVIDDPKGGRGSATLDFGGLWSLLEHRIATEKDFTDGTALAKSTLAYTGKFGNLGAIAADLVKRAMLRPNGWFPFRVASPSEAGIVDRVRNYQGFNVSNNSVAKRITEITEVINGPDIAFRPAWVRRGTAVEWVMHHGTEGMPEIAQEHTFSIDLTAPKAAVMEPAVSAKSSLFARAYMSAAGEGETTLVEIVSRTPTEKLPWLETVASDGQTENDALLRSRGEVLIKPSRIAQFAVSVPASGPMPLHLWNTGDEMQIRVPEGWLQIAPGTYRMRIVSRSGTLTSDMVKIEFQPEELIRSG